jgi:hypothetical protein
MEDVLLFYELRVDLLGIILYIMRAKTLLFLEGMGASGGSNNLA